MTFNELQQTFKKEFETEKLADIAREFDVTPQVVSNWKSRDQVPYKYVKLLRKRIKKLKNNSHKFNLSSDQATLISSYSQGNYSNNEDQTFTEFILVIYSKLIRNRIILFIVPISFFLLGQFYLIFLAKPVYVSSAKLLPISSEKSTGGIKSIANQFGLGIQEKSSTGLSSSDMVPEIIKSRLLAKDLLKYKFKSLKFDTELPLINILSENSNQSVDWPEASVNVFATIVGLNIAVEREKESSLLNLIVYASEPILAKQLADAVIDRLNIIMSRFKISQVQEKKKFIENRLMEVKIDLEGAEEDLKNFREKNRSILSSPALMLEQARLIREVEVQSQVYITLKQEFEMVQIEEVDRSTIVQILDAPEIPLEKTKPVPAKIITISIILGIFMGLSSILLKDWYIDNRSYF